MEHFTPNVGDTVQVRKFVLDRWYQAEGPVEAIRYDPSSRRPMAYVANDWWILSNDMQNQYETIQPPDARCYQCGAGGELAPLDVVTLYDENGHDDDGGCFSKHRTAWQCRDLAECRARTAAMSDLLLTMARFSDQDLAEQGKSGIGRGGAG